MYVLHGLPTQGSPAELPVGKMPRTSSDDDGDVDPFSAPACPGNRVNFGGGKLPLTTVPRCDMLVPWRTLNGRHPATAKCARGADQKIRWLVEAELRESTERALEAYEELLENLKTFKYLVQVMTAVDDDCPAVVGNLRKARKGWGRLLRILSWWEEDKKVLGHFF